MALATLRLLVLSAAFAVTFANVYFATAPGEMKFLPAVDSKLRRSELPHVINFLMGLPLKYQHATESWTGMENVDIFNPPSANLLITVHVPADNHFYLSRYVMEYNTSASEYEASPVSDLNRAILSEYQDEDLVKSFALQNQFGDKEMGTADTDAIRERLNSDESVLESLPVGSFTSLNKDIDPDVYLFGELQMIKDTLQNMEKSGKTYEKQSFHVILTSLDHLVRRYGASSLEVNEAIALLQYFIPHFVESANAKFHGQLLCEVDVTEVLPDASLYLVRHSRALLEADAEAEKPTAQPATLHNIVPPVSSDFAVVFNIVLWLMIGFFLAVLAATYVMWFMDPGKDNIIYRVTSQRMKSD